MSTRASRGAIAVALLASSGFACSSLGGKSKMRVVARLDEPGKWLYHCHILEHGEAGMMGEIDVQ